MKIKSDTVRFDEEINRLENLELVTSFYEEDGETENSWDELHTFLGPNQGGGNLRNIECIEHVFEDSRIEIWLFVWEDVDDEEEKSTAFAIFNK
jgi:hypothetical protein